MTHRLGIDLGGTKLSGVVLDPQGEEVARSRLPSPRDDYPGTIAAVAGLVKELEAAAGAPAGQATVGVGTPGTWQPRLECMKNCNSTWLNDQPLLRDLQKALGPRVRIANDADCLGLSEAGDGAGAAADSVFAVILGTGVGGAVVVRGRLLQGPNGLVGEWGHVPLPYFRQPVFAVGMGAPGSAEQARFQLESRLGERRCYCGRLNCIETFLAGPGLAATHRELWGETCSAEAIASGADGHRGRTLELYQHMLARALAQVVNLIDPGVIVLGGGVSNAAGLGPVLEELIPAYAFTSVHGTGSREEGDVRVQVRRARWGDDSGVRGAARLWEAKA